MYLFTNGTEGNLVWAKKNRGIMPDIGGSYPDNLTGGGYRQGLEQRDG